MLGPPMLAAALLSSAPAGAATPPAFSVDVVKVQGVVDPALAAYVRGTIAEAERAGATVVLQLDSRGSYADLGPELGETIRRSTVPVVAWVGPSGARASGGALFLVYGSSLVAVAPGSGIGPGRPYDLSTTASAEPPGEVARWEGQLEALGRGAGLTSAGVRAALAQALPAGPALDRGAASLAAPGVPELLAALDGRVVQTARGTVTLATADRQGRSVTVRFHEIGPIDRVLHSVSTPAAVYVLLLLGLWGVAFELTQPGLGIAGILGALSLAFAGYGLSVVPVQWPGISLILAGTAMQGADVLIRRVHVLTVAGTAALASGSVLAWRGVAPAIDLAPWLIALATVASFLFFGFALTVALGARERVRSAQVGLVGLVGEVRTDLDPEGGVLVKGALWRARSMDGRIPRGTRVRVRGIDGLILRVEQEPE